MTISIIINFAEKILHKRTYRKLGRGSIRWFNLRQCSKGLGAFSSGE